VRQETETEGEREREREREREGERDRDRERSRVRETNLWANPQEGRHRLESTNFVDYLDSCHEEGRSERGGKVTDSHHSIIPLRIDLV
jgi:hypothetical protein